MCGSVWLRLTEIAACALNGISVATTCWPQPCLLAKKVPIPLKDLRRRMRLRLVTSLMEQGRERMQACEEAQRQEKGPRGDVSRAIACRNPDKCGSQTPVFSVAAMVTAMVATMMAAMVTTIPAVGPI